MASYVAAGAYSWWRRPDPLVASVGFLYTAVSLNAPGAPLAYTLGMVAWVAVSVCLPYVYLCFPPGSIGVDDRAPVRTCAGGQYGGRVGLILALSPTLPVGATSMTAGRGARWDTRARAASRRGGSGAVQGPDAARPVSAAMMSVVAPDELHTAIVVFAVTLLNAILGLNQGGKAAESVAALHRMAFSKRMGGMVGW